MSDGSEEVTASREPTSTENLLEETEQLLSGESGGVSEEIDPESREATVAEGDRDAEYDLDEEQSGSWLGSDAEPEAGTTNEESTESRTGSLRSKLSPTRYFSPKAFLALVLLIGTGVLVGGTFVPVVGRMLGMFTTAFLVGLLASKRRYLEVAAAGTSVGAVAALLNYAIFALVGGGGTLLAIGTTAGLVACLVGYYFGRDLRDGLQRDL